MKKVYTPEELLAGRTAERDKYLAEEVKSYLKVIPVVLSPVKEVSFFVNDWTMKAALGHLSELSVCQAIAEQLAGLIEDALGPDVDCLLEERELGSDLLISAGSWKTGHNNLAY